MNALSMDIVMVSRFGNEGKKKQENAGQEWKSRRYKMFEVEIKMWLSFYNFYRLRKSLNVTGFLWIVDNGCVEECGNN